MHGRPGLDQPEALAAWVHRLWWSRRQEDGGLRNKMYEVRTAYDGDLALPLPELESGGERLAVANLFSTGVDQIGMRVASVAPNIHFPMMVNNETEKKIARDRVRAVKTWEKIGKQDLVMRRRARQFVGQGLAPVMIRPGGEQMPYPVAQVLDPLTTFPGTPIMPDDPVVPDCVAATPQPWGYINANWPHVAGLLRRSKQTDWHLPPSQRRRPDDPSETFWMLTYSDPHVVVTVAIPNNGGTPAPPDGHNAAGAVFVSGDHNRIERCWVVCPTMIGLGGTRPGRFHGMLGAYQAQARLFALEVIGIEKGIFPERWLVARPGETPRVITRANGRTGTVGELQGGDLRDYSITPAFQTGNTIDRLERNARAEGGVSPDLQGEAATGIRTGRRGENVLHASIDFPIQEAHNTFEHARAAELEIAAQLDRTYLSGRKIFHVAHPVGTKSKDYDPAVLWDERHQHVEVSYANAGADVNSQAIANGQKLGMRSKSRLSVMQEDPTIRDAEWEHDQIIWEALEDATLDGLRQAAATMQIPPGDMARIMDLVKMGDELTEAIRRTQEEAQERQAQQVAAEDPAAQPGIAAPGAGAEASPTIPQADPSIRNLGTLMSQLRRPQMSLPGELPG